MNKRRLKIEVLEPRLLLASDFGDAPDPYETRLSDNGARHEATGLMLGTQRDSETDGIPSISALGDDTSVVDDEDGVSWGLIHAGQLDSSVTVIVQNATESAFVDAWIDFNGDGSWADAGERILAGAPVSNGANVLEFDVPSDALFGTTYARVRLSSIGFLNPTGEASDGEVEDYEVSIASPLPATGRFVPHDVIPFSRDYTRSVASADLDGDGDMDIVSASGFTAIAWYENNGYQASFDTHVLRSAPDVQGIAVHVNDIDSDGDVDILAVVEADDQFGRHELYWYENDGSGAFTERLIDNSNNIENVRWITSVDLDEDGYFDILAPVGWYKNDGNQNFVYERELSLRGGVHDPIDIDRDGDIDLVSTKILGGGLRLVRE